MYVYMHNFYVERTIFDVYDALTVYVEVQMCTSTSFSCTYTSFQNCRIRRFSAYLRTRLRNNPARVRARLHIYVLYVYVQICISTSLFCTYTCTYVRIHAQFLRRTHNFGRIRRFDCVRRSANVYIYVVFLHVYVVSKLSYTSF